MAKTFLQSMARQRILDISSAHKLAKSLQVQDRMKDPFWITMDLIQLVLNQSLTPEYRKIWIDGTNKPGSTKICFTFFPTGHGQYDMKFISMKNFRSFRPDGDPDEETNFVLEYASQFQTLLPEVILPF